MPNNKKSEYYVTVNAQQAVAMTKALETELKNLQNRYKQLVAAQKEGTDKARQMARDIRDLESVIKQNKVQYELIDKVMQNLSGSTLSQLQRALRNVKKSMNLVSEDSGKLATLREQYAAIERQIKMMQGAMVNVKKHLGELSTMTDSWLQRAIQQQRQQVAGIDQQNQKYQQQMAVLKQLEAEEQRRAQVAAVTRYNQAVSTVQSGTASASALTDARKAIVARRDSLDRNNPQNVAEIEKINQLLDITDKQIADIFAKEQKIEITTQQLATDAAKVALNPQKFTPAEIEAKLKAIQTRLKSIPANDPFRKELAQSAQKLKTILSGLEHEAVDVADVLKKMKQGKASFDELERAAKKLENEIRLIGKNEADFISKSKQLSLVRSELERSTLSVKKHSSAWSTTLRNMTAYFGAFQLFSMVHQKLTAIFKLNLKFSDQLADIRKVSGLAIQDINNLSQSLAKIDTRTTIEELNQIAYAGAKLGIGKYGTAGLEQFVRAANQVNVALKEDLGADALTALSKITEVMGLIPKMGVEKSMLAVGSAMFQLSATSTATSNNIVEFSKRLTGIARTAGITTDQLLALGSAADSMYLMPEVASTAFNKLISSLQTKHNLIEKELSIAPGTINQLYSAGRAIDAIVLIFEKMKEKGNMNALQGVFKDLGSDGARLVNVAVTMAKNVDMLKEHLATSKDAFEEATAVSKEYAIQQQTAQALMERANNIWEKAFVNPEGVDRVKEMAQSWYDLSKSMTSNKASMLAMKLLLDMIATSMEKIIYLLPAILLGLSFKGVSAAIMGVASSIGLMGKASVLATIQTQGLVAAWKSLNAAQKTNIIGLVISLLTTLAIVVYDVVKSVNQATTYMDGFNNTMSDFNREFAVAEDRLKRYKKAITDAKKGSNEHKAAIKNFNKEFGPYLSNLLTEKSTAQDLAKAYKEVVKQLKAKIALQLRDKDIEKHVVPRIGWAAEWLSKYGSSVGDKSPYNAAWLKGLVDDAWESGKSISQIAARLRQTFKVTDEQFINIINKANASKLKGVPTYTTHNSIHGAYTQETNDPVSDNEQNIWLALRYARQIYSANNAQKSVDDKWKPFEEVITDVTAEEDDDPPGTLDEKAIDKDALKAEKEAEQRQRKEWRDNLKEAQDEARAVIDNIKNFYQRQIIEVERTANEQNWDTTLTEAAVRAIEGRMNLALSQARKSIAGVENTWEQFKTTMNEDMREQADDVGYNESQVLLNNIQNANINALHERILSLSSNLGLPANAAINAIWKNASLNEQANETAEQKRRKLVQQRLLDDNFTGKVDNEYTQSMETLGFFDLTPEQLDVLLTGGTNATELLQRRSNEIETVLKNARENIIEIYAIDPQTTDGRNRLMEILFGENWDQDNSELKHIFELVGDDLQVFYSELIKYSDSYTEALKKSRERQKKIIDEQWMKTPTYKANEDEQKHTEMMSSGVGQYSADVQKRKAAGERVPRKDIYGTASFISSMGHDPEIDSYRLKMEAAAAYYDFLKAHQADAETLRDAEQAVLKSEMDYAKAVAEQMKQRMSDIYELAAPIDDFGTSVGEAFATMTEDAEEGRKALRAAIGDMINSFMKQTIEMSKEYIKRRMMQKINDRLTSVAMKKSTKQLVTLEDQKQGQITQVQEQGGEAQKFLNEAVQGDIQQATQEIGNQTLQVQQTQTQQEVQTEAAKTQANTTMGIASGASKIIGSLGWWGIPLVAVITALLNGLLSFAMGKVSSLFGGGKDNGSDSGPTVKLASGMLTYDSGNVQAFRGVQDGKTYPVVGNDGRVYAAKDGGELSTGLVRDPITTLVNGQPALVAERGPEMVIGRETTAAMMMARPDLLAEIVKFDRNRSGQTYRAYDSGNVAAIASALPAGATVLDGSQSGLTPADIAALRDSLDGFAAVMTLIQRNGLHVNKFGRGSVTEASASGTKFMQKYSGDRLWRKQ